MSKYRNPDLTAAIPELAPEVIASTLTPDTAVQDQLCSRLHRHWQTSQAFRDSFKRKKPRAVCHWHAAILAKL